MWYKSSNTVSNWFIYENVYKVSYLHFFGDMMVRLSLSVTDTLSDGLSYVMD